MLQDAPSDFCLQPNFIEGVKAVSKFNLSFDVSTLSFGTELIPRYASGITNWPMFSNLFLILGPTPVLFLTTSENRTLKITIHSLGRMKSFNWQNIKIYGARFQDWLRKLITKTGNQMTLFHISLTRLWQFTL